MTKRKTTEHNLSTLDAQAEATRRAAAETTNSATKDLAYAAAATLDSIARSQKRKLNLEPILELHESASAPEVNQARQRRAVRRGQDVYLPSWREATVGMPNLLLRSALFSSSAAGETLFDAPIASQGDTVLSMTGFKLSDYDRRVFAACLNYYREDRPLSSSVDPKFVEISFWQLSRDLQVAYGANVHRAIRGSLIRLNAAHLRIRVKRQEIPMPRLIEVAFEDGYAGSDTTEELLRGSDLIAFRIFDSMANLFGPADWSSVSATALHDFSGLPSWLTSFYSTHAGPYPVKFSELYKYSGVTCETREFRRRLKVALTKLQSDDVSPAVRVANFALEKNHVTVELTRWKT
ncbi:MAG: hypothetical protein EPN76_09555 [Burkholderiaceae bacterium]|nr:MAG: hypothetical protein EPN76_09555 [Burkholderiaceae bacterium]